MESFDLNERPRRKYFHHPAGLFFPDNMALNKGF